MKWTLPARGSRIGTFAAAIAVAALLAACGSDDDNESSGGGAATTTAAKECSGAPLKIHAIMNLTAQVSQQAPEVPAGAKAAAAAITKSCQLGRPLEVVSCDDQFNPNTDAKCGRDAVADKALAVVAFSGFGDSYGPIVTKAGIPILPANATAPTESTNKLSFPFGYPITSVFAQLNLAAQSGGKRLALFALGIPSVKFFVDLVQQQAELVGMKVVTNIAVPPTATDMTSYVGQAVDSKADSFVTIMPPAAQLSIFKGLREQGIDFQNSHVAGSLLTANPTFLRDLGAENASGLLLSSWAWSPTDTSKPFIKQYLAELKAAGQKSGPFDVDMLGVTTWASVHVLADALKAKNLDPTPANVAKAFNSEVVPGLTEKYGLAPIDFTKPAYPDNPALSKLRLFSRRESNWKVNSEGVPQPISQEWVDVLEKPSAGG